MVFYIPGRIFQIELMDESKYKYSFYLSSLSFIFILFSLVTTFLGSYRLLFFGLSIGAQIRLLIPIFAILFDDSLIRVI